MLSIGEFARYAGVSVRMLRHYDSLGLLVPARVDPSSGYRYYAADQLMRLNRLVALKDLGFTLDQVGAVLSADLSVEQLRGMLILRRAQIMAQIDADHARLREIEARLRMIEKEGTMSELDFVEKSVPSVRLAQLTDEVASQPELGMRVGPLFDRARDLLDKAGLPVCEPALAWYDSREDGIRFGAGFPVSVDSVDGLQVVDQPAYERALTVLHHGSMETIGDSWQALATEVGRRGLQCGGPGREVYLQTPMDSQENWVTELQQPLRPGR
jgi:DNA-binding transcriptional MerR regulator